MAAGAADSRFARVVDAIAEDREVSQGSKKGFGSAPLKVKRRH